MCAGRNQTGAIRRQYNWVDHRQIYKRIPVFSRHRLLWDVLAFVILAALGIVGFYAVDRFTDKGLVGLAVGLLIGIILVVVILRYVSYAFKAGQIATISGAVSESDLPDDVLAEGRREVKARFVTIALFYAATGVIKGIFNQLGRVLRRGQHDRRRHRKRDCRRHQRSDPGPHRKSLRLLSGLGFYRKDQNAAKATCEGAVLFFRHGKTLAKNMGRIFGFGLLSFLLIGGLFAAVFYLILSGFSAAFADLSAEFTQFAACKSISVPEWLQDPTTFTIACSILAAAILWSILHEVFVRPFVPVGVMRNYLVSGMNDIPDKSFFKLLDDKSPKFAKLHREAA